jgi:hypothetical protein
MPSSLHPGQYRNPRVQIDGVIAVDRHRQFFARISVSCHWNPYPQEPCKRNVEARP